MLKRFFSIFCGSLCCLLLGACVSTGLEETYRFDLAGVEQPVMLNRTSGPVQGKEIGGYLSSYAAGTQVQSSTTDTLSGVTTVTTTDITYTDNSLEPLNQQVEAQLEGGERVLYFQGLTFEAHTFFAPYFLEINRALAVQFKASGEVAK